MRGINIDWHEEFKNNVDEWENITQRVLRGILEDPEHERFKEIAKRLDVLKEDGELEEYWEESINSYEPIMNYGYILETEPEDNKVLEVALKTNCSVMYNSDQDLFYIVLNSGGMDLSQDIGLSYVILEEWIPEDFIKSISIQEGLSISKDNFKTLKNAIIEQSKIYEERFKRLREEWSAT